MHAGVKVHYEELELTLGRVQSLKTEEGGDTGNRCKAERRLRRFTWLKVPSMKAGRVDPYWASKLRMNVPVAMAGLRSSGLAAPIRLAIMSPNRAKRYEYGSRHDQAEPKARTQTIDDAYRQARLTVMRRKRWSDPRALTQHESRCSNTRSLARGGDLVSVRRVRVRGRLLHELPKSASPLSASVEGDECDHTRNRERASRHHCPR